MMKEFAFCAKGSIRPVLLLFILYSSIVMIVPMTIVNFAHASGNLATPPSMQYSVSVWTHCIPGTIVSYPVATCSLQNEPISCSASSWAALAPCVAAVAGGAVHINNFYGNYAGGNPPGYTNVIAAHIGCPANAQPTGPLCTCTDPYIPDSTQTICVTGNNCPVNMSGIPCACNTDYVPNPNGPGCVYQTLTLTIESIYSTKGPFTTLPNGILSLKAVVKDQFGLAKAGKQVTLSMDVQGGSGGHDHNENRPKGETCAQLFGYCTLGATDSSGEAGFSFRAPAVAGEHTITATCTGCSTANATVNVKLDGLLPIPASPFYALQDSAGKVIGTIQGKHSANHYLTAPSITGLGMFARDYQTKVNFGERLYLNDASLVWGGLFDVGSTPWKSPHIGHDRGRSIDIRAENNGPNNEGAVPSAYFKDTIKSAARAHAKAALHCTADGNLVIGDKCNHVPHNRHFHVDF